MFSIIILERRVFPITSVFVAIIMPARALIPGQRLDGISDSYWKPDELAYFPASSGFSDEEWIGLAEEH